MANRITRSIPNTLTCLNLFSGCIACVMAFEANYNLALVFIILSAVFDFFDGMMARLLNAHWKGFGFLGGRCKFRCSTLIGSIFPIQRNVLSGIHGVHRSLHAVCRIPYFRILGAAFGEIQ